MLGILEVDLAEAPRAGDGAPEAVGGAPQQAAALAREGGEVLHGGSGPRKRDGFGELPRCAGRARHPHGGLEAELGAETERGAAGEEGKKKLGKSWV